MKYSIPLAPAAPQPTPRFDLIDLPIVGRFLRNKHARTIMQIPLFLIAAVMIWDGLWGPQLAPKNLATVVTWVQYRGILVLALLVAGNLFCMACPFMLPRNLARKFVKPALIWPRRLRNKWVAVGLFALFLFVYELFDLWATPLWTAWLIIAYFAAALVIDSLFQGASFCKYVCPLGQFNFASALMSPLEVSVRQPDVCASCQTRDCINGNDQQRGCELYLFQPRKIGNMDCTFCLDCVHACPHDNAGIAPRLPASELWVDPVRSGIGRFGQRTDLAALATIFTFGALINAFGMVSPVYALEQWLANLFNIGAEAPILGLIFTLGLIIEPVLLLALAAWIMRRLTGSRDALPTLATRYAYALIPLGFGVWIAHYAYHFLTGAWTIIPVVQTIASDLGAPVLGTPRWDLGALVSTTWLAPVQFGFIGLGWFVLLLGSYQLAQSDAPQQPWRAWLPWAGLLVILAIAALWLMAQPMEMRGTLFAS